MGSTATAKLVYGWNLGGAEEGWHLQEVDEDGSWAPTWLPEDDADDPAGHIRTVLLRSTGIVNGPYPPNQSTDDAWEKHRELVKQAEQQLGIHTEPEFHGHYDFLQVALVAYAQEADWGVTGFVNFAELEARRVAERWDHHLAEAARVLGITPVKPSNDWREIENDPPRLRDPFPPQYLLLCEYM